MTIELPYIPASLNELFDMHYRPRSQWTKQRKEDVAWRCKNYAKVTERVDIRFLIISGNKHKKDPSNYTAKAEIDGFVLGGLLKNDNSDFVRSVTYEVQYGEDDKTIVDFIPC